MKPGRVQSFTSFPNGPAKRLPIYVVFERAAAHCLPRNCGFTYTSCRIQTPTMVTPLATSSIADSYAGEKRRTPGFRPELDSVPVSDGLEQIPESLSASVFSKNVS